MIRESFNSHSNMTERKKMEEKKIVVRDTVPKFEISLEDSKERFNAMQRFIAEHMKNGIDYAPIPNTNGKPVLLKPGAEKLNQIFGFFPEFFKLNEVIDHEKQFYYVEYKCVLKKKSDYGKQAEGIGSCNNKEKAKLSVDMYTQMNTINKVAQKRAYMAATLIATALSQQYTQDLDDDVVQKNINECSQCKAKITEKVVEFSTAQYGKPLCFNCQGKQKKKA